MKRILYRTLIHKSRVELEKEGAGNVITKAISDVDDCVEGMRKFTTEIFDTGVALFGYVCMLLYYDWRLALCSMIFPPFSYIIAEKMKRIVQTTGAAYKKQTGKLNAVTLDRITNAITYRVFGCEKERGENYEVHLKEYEQAAVKANIWNAALPPGLQGDRHGGNCDDPVFRFRKYPRNGLDVMGCGGIYHIPGMLREALR